MFHSLYSNVVYGLFEELLTGYPVFRQDSAGQIDLAQVSTEIVKIEGYFLLNLAVLQNLS